MDIPVNREPLRTENSAANAGTTESWSSSLQERYLEIKTLANGENWSAFSQW